MNINQIKVMSKENFDSKVTKTDDDVLYFVEHKPIRFDTGWFTAKVSTGYTFDLTNEDILKLDITDIRCKILGKIATAGGIFAVDDIAILGYCNINGTKSSKSHGITPYIYNNTLYVRFGTSNPFTGANTNHLNSVAIGNAQYKVILEGFKR